MSLKLQKTLILKTKCELYKLVKKTQNINQILRNITKKNAEFEYAFHVFVQKFSVVIATNEQLRQITSTYVFRQMIFVVAITSEFSVNAVQCFNCKKFDHVFRDCRMFQNRELTMKNIKKNNEQKKNQKK